MTQSLSKAIFYIKYYAKKHDCIIARKATLDDNGCGEHKHKKFGYPYFKYVDLDQTEILGNDKDGNPQYRHASKSWEINQTRTIS